MGSISFLLPDTLPDTARALLPSACFATGYDQDPTPTPLEILGDRLVASWELSESRYLCLPWPVASFGAPVTTTATLRESPQPYRLMVELARGKLNQVRTQAAEWVGIGLRAPTGFDQALGDAGRVFSAALCAAPAEADTMASRVLVQSYRLGDTLAREFIGQLLDTRHQDEGPLDTRFAARTLGGPGDAGGEYANTFNAAQVGLRWSDVEPEESRLDWAATDRAVEAAKAADLPVTLGPVIDLAPGMTPEWVNGWAGDLPTLAAFMCDFLEAAVRQYKSDVRRWVVCAGFNQAGALGLDDDDRLRLAFRLFETAMGIDPDLELVVSVAQPWGDYRIQEDRSISPITFPDDLIRTGLKLSAVELEFRLGTTPRGSRPRDLLEVWRALQLFSGLGLPLEVVLAQPSSGEVDPRVLGESVWTAGGLAAPSPQSQVDTGAALAALALSSPDVRAVTWDHWSDQEPHLTPYSGLLDGEGRPKPLLDRLRSLRTAHLR